MASFLKKLGHLSNKSSYSYHLLSFFLFLQELSFGTITLQIRLLVFVYELIIYEIIFLYTWLRNYYYSCFTGLEEN